MSFFQSVKKYEVSASDNFVAEISDLSIFREDYDLLGFSKDDDLSLEKTTLVWELEPEYRKYGIKDFGVYVPDQEISVVGEVNGDDGSDPFIKAVKIFNVEVEYEKSESGKYPHLYPVKLDYYQKKWTVTFSVG